MALRVLLADESTTIKKVMQLALQDFAVEVKSVHSGLDVTEVARGFNPDIIFTDVLLQKKNGYEVCVELKKHPQLGKLPLVLMWSSFMELDERLASTCGADRRLEKPFEVDHLRQIVMELVPKTRSQRLANFLQFSDNVAAPLKEEVEARSVPEKKPEAKPEPKSDVRPGSKPTPAAAAPSSWNMESFEPISEFADTADRDEETKPLLESQMASPSMPLAPETPSTHLPITDDDDDEQFAEMRIQNQHAKPTAQQSPKQVKRDVHDDRDPWSHQDLNRFKIDLPPVTAQSDDVEISMELPETKESFTNVSFVRKREEQTQAGTRGAHQAAANDLNDPELGLELHELEMEGADSLEALEDNGGDSRLEIEPSHAGLSLTEIQGGEMEIEIPLTHPTEKIRARTDRSSSQPATQMSADHLEAIIRAQSREIIEEVVRRVVPDLASRMIREELARLLDESRENQHEGSR